MSQPTCGPCGSAPDGWCKARLKSGDTLASLEKLYSVPAQNIAKKNGVPWSSAAIYSWVLATGGTKTGAKDGQGLDIAAFTDSSVILLPKGGARPCCCGSTSTKPVKPKAAEKARWPWYLALATLLGVAAKRKRKGS